MRNRAVHGVLDVDGRHAVQVVRDGAEDLHEAGVQGGYGCGPAHQNDARVQERHQAELHHQVGNRRRRQPGQSHVVRIYLKQLFWAP